jgi:hypothetical protein
VMFSSGGAGGCYVCLGARQRGRCIAVNREQHLAYEQNRPANSFVSLSLSGPCQHMYFVLYDSWWLHASRCGSFKFPLGRRSFMGRPAGI